MPSNLKVGETGPIRRVPVGGYFTLPHCGDVCQRTAEQHFQFCYADNTLGTTRHPIDRSVEIIVITRVSTAQARRLTKKE